MFKSLRCATEIEAVGVLALRSLTWSTSDTVAVGYVVQDAQYGASKFEALWDTYF